jgi:hypothetical protein
MKELNNQELRDEIIELFLSDLIDNWTKSPSVYDLDNCAQLDIEVEPDDAKSIDEIKQFKIIQIVMGSETMKFTRKL